MTLNSNSSELDIYSDGSCHTRYRVGGWAAIIWIGGKKIVLTGIVPGSTNNRMELTAVIKALVYVRENYATIKTIKIYSDSQYVIGLPGRKEKLMASGFSTKKGNQIPNSDLVIELLEQLTFFSVEWKKIKAHQKNSSKDNYNIEADKLSRKKVREAVRSDIPA
jgi:ribonuclease HI